MRVHFAANRQQANKMRIWIIVSDRAADGIGRWADQADQTQKMRRSDTPLHDACEQLRRATLVVHQQQKSSQKSLDVHLSEFRQFLEREGPAKEHAPRIIIWVSRLIDAAGSRSYTHVGIKDQAFAWLHSPPPKAPGAGDRAGKVSSLVSNWAFPACPDLTAVVSEEQLQEIKNPSICWSCDDDWRWVSRDGVERHKWRIGDLNLPRKTGGIRSFRWQTTQNPTHSVLCIPMLTRG